MARYTVETHYLTLTTAAADTETAGFVVPKDVKGLTVIAPNLTTDTTFELEILDPADSAQGTTESWSAISGHRVGVATSVALTDLADNGATYIYPVPNGCVLRIAFTTAQAATFTVIFHY